ncbi:MAG: DEAD/DEAH box helicase family protein [Candidatus Lokiarchaeota archaeon]|nr:DEAD/DEAH box helicase family protein [Candidatus Lokiarchaeota archaeon]
MMDEITDINIKSFNYKCPFCGNTLESRYSKCFNIYCSGKEFNENNFIIYRLNPNLGIGKIIKQVKIPVSKSLDEDDLTFITKYKVIFNNNIQKIIHPIDLIHYVFQINEKIQSQKNIGIINDSNLFLKDGQISYEIILPDGKKSQIYESEIESLFQPNLNQKILKKDIDPPRNFLIKYWANLFDSYYKSHHIKCITNSRLNLMPHQINVAHRLSKEYFPRMILADEVGLGKTIEAGIYIKEMMARTLVERILIIVPATLVKQWKFEMKNKFNIEFSIYDGKKFKQYKVKGNNKNPKLLENPFYYDNLILCSLQFARNPKYRELLSQIAWDIVIFDEAHHLRRYLTNISTENYRETRNYLLARKISDNCESLLLLTATPLQLHSFELYSLIELIHPGEFENFSDFEHFRKNMPFINLLASNIKTIDKLNSFELKNTIKLLKNFKYINENQSDNAVIHYLQIEENKNKLIERIEKDHTLSKFLIRNRKQKVFPKELLNERIVNTIMVHPKNEELSIYNEIRIYLAKIYNSALNRKNPGIGFIITTLQKLLTSSKYAILKSLERRLEQITKLKNLKTEFKELEKEDPEFFQSELEEEFLDTESELESISSNFSKIKTDKKLIDVLNQENIIKEFYIKLKKIPYDSKSEKFIEIIDQIYKKNPKEKILVFTQFVDTLLYLKDLIYKSNQQFTIKTFYGGLNKEAKDNAVEEFRNSKNLSILLSTEIGGEGRNFQFCRVLINYDLPWNPMKLEQRIGRLDRIGQESRKIFIYNLFMEGTIENDILFALNKRINIFEESIGYLEPIIGKIERDFKDLIFSEPEQKQRKLREFNFDIENQLKSLKETNAQFDDFMIDKKSFQIKDLLSFISSCEDIQLSHNELFYFITYFFNLEDNYGSIINTPLFYKKEEISNYSKIILEKAILNFLHQKLLKEYNGTFNLEIARNREEIDFFALGHPLINSIINFCINKSFLGDFTTLYLDKEKVIQYYSSIDKIKFPLYLFIYKTTFQGFIIESHISTILIDKDFKEIKNLSDIILDINNYNSLFNYNVNNNEDLILDIKNLEIMDRLAQEYIQKNLDDWKKEIISLNESIFNLDMDKRNRLFQGKLIRLEKKKNKIELKLQKKNESLPKEKQLIRITQLSNVKEKENRLRKIKEIKEQIHFLREDVSKITNKLEDLKFFYDDLRNEMKKRKKKDFSTEFLSLACIRID